MSVKIPENPWNSPVFYYDRLDSTNLELLRQGRKGAVEGTTVIAACQDKGRGRRGRQWYSPDGGLWMSILIIPPKSIRLPAGLSLLVGLSCAEALEVSGGISPSLKWPNDIMLDNKKIGGILIESSIGPRGRFLVVGIGINVAVEQFPLELDNTAASLEGANFSRGSRWILAGEILVRLHRFYQSFIRAGSAACCMEKYRLRSVTLGKEVKVHRPGGYFIGLAEEILPGGELIVKDEAGIRHQINSGEVSVRHLKKEKNALK